MIDLLCMHCLPADVPAHFICQGVSLCGIHAREYQKTINDYAASITFEPHLYSASKPIEATELGGEV